MQRDESPGHRHSAALRNCNESLPAPHPYDKLQILEVIRIGLKGVCLICGVPGPDAVPQEGPRVPDVIRMRADLGALPFRLSKQEVRMFLPFVSLEKYVKG